MAKDLKRSLTIAGHRTSLSLESEFWDALLAEAATRRQSVAALVAEIDRGRGERNLSSAVRVWLFAAAKARRNDRG
ncbi:MAG: ribbon-helix-helix domain-containing protein [Alphaproteobacteria bacterium]|nr:ribbon-helix-helix domain-containing protein [Alphaproteobacteria bacterium]